MRRIIQQIDSQYRVYVPDYTSLVRPYTTLEECRDYCDRAISSGQVLMRLRWLRDHNTIVPICANPIIEHHGGSEYTITGLQKIVDRYHNGNFDLSINAESIFELFLELI